MICVGELAFLTIVCDIAIGKIRREKYMSQEIYVVLVLGLE